jgi:hypothetical protein
VSELAYVTDSGVVDQNPAAKQARDRIRQGREHRRQFEPIWQLNAAFAAGQHWLVADRLTRTLRRVQDVDPTFKGVSDGQLYSFDVITEYRTTALGELATDDDRPELLLERDDQASEEFQAALNRSVQFGWDHEWDGDEALGEADRMAVDLGTSAIQVYFDPTAGPTRPGENPYHQGKPVFGDQARQLLENGPRPDVTMRQTNEGRICWRPLSPFNLIVPPGVTHEKYFPWQCTVIPTPVAEIKERYGPVAAEIKEDADIGSILGMEAQTTSSSPSGWMIGDSRRTRLRDHAWLFTYYEQPTEQYKTGRTLVFVNNQMKLLEVRDGTGGQPGLPYQGPDGSYRAGISYLHWWRVTGRFWSRSLVSSLQDIQRALDKRETQKNSIIDRGLPFVIAEEGSELENRAGVALEVLLVKPQSAPPVVNQGVGPGDWFYKDIDAMREALQHASGIRAPSLGENPVNVTTYSQLSLIFEADQTKRLPMMRERRQAIKQLVEDSVYDIRTYWGHDKQILLAGDENRAQAEVFDATRIPSFFIVHVSKGAAKPRSQAAELKLVEQIWEAALNSGAIAKDPDAWIKWYYDSLEAGEPLAIPESKSDDQVDLAQLENHLMWQGQPVEPADYDPIEVHLPIHRSAMIQARVAGAQGVLQLIQQHIDQTEQLAMQAVQSAAQVAQSQVPPPLPGATGPPPPPGQPPEQPQPQLPPPVGQ